MCSWFYFIEGRYRLIQGMLWRLNAADATLKQGLYDRIKTLDICLLYNMRVCVYIYKCIHPCVPTYTYTYTHIHIHIHIHIPIHRNTYVADTYECAYTYIYIYTYEHLYIYIYAHAYTRTHACVYIYIYTHMHTYPDMHRSSRKRCTRTCQLSFEMPQIRSTTIK